MKIKIILLLFILLPVFLFAGDFGLAVNLQTGYGSLGSNAFDIVKADIWPRYSALIGDNSDLIVSGGFTFGLSSSNDELDNYFVFEILHTELTLRFGTAGIKLGRFNYSDPLSFIAEGLFDGAQFFYNSDAGNFRIGGWYTGLLYKKNANITMTPNDLTNQIQPVSYDKNFADTYFAPSRFFTAIGWEHPSIGEALHLNVSIIAQVDNTGADYHNMYGIFKAGFPINHFLAEVGFAAEMTLPDSEIGYAGDIGLFWLFPGEFNSRLSLSGKLASGKRENFDPFVPITSKNFGYIFKQKITGLRIVSLDYSSRFNQSLSASFTASYFWRDDSTPVSGHPSSLDSEGKHRLGPDISAQFRWSPASDLQLNLNGGVFIPAAGNVMNNDPIQWRTELTVTMSLL